MKKKILNTLCFLLAVVFLIGCGEWEGEYDFRNYLRDKHPYSEIKEIDLSGWAYQVNDTLKGEIWIYTSSRSENSVRRHCVNCN